MVIPDDADGEHGLEMGTGPDGGYKSVSVVVASVEDRPADSEERYPRGTSSRPGAVANVVNTIVGAGVVGLPFALAQSGLWAGLGMMFLAAYLNGQANIMLVRAGDKVGKLNYEELVSQTFGTMGIHVYGIFVGLLTFGSMSAYLIVVGDTIPEILRASGVTDGVLADRRSVVALFGVFCMLPVSLLRDMSKLAYTSFTSVLSDALLIIIVVAAATNEGSPSFDTQRAETLEPIRPTIFAGFGAVSFAFVCQQSSFLIYRSMATGGVKRWASVIKASMSIALIMGLTLSIGGYLHFGEDTQGNILNNFPPDSKPASAARALLAITMVFTYPMEMYVARHVIDFSLFQTWFGFGPITAIRHYGITLVLWALTIIVSTSMNNLGLVLEVFGSSSSTVVGYILPALLHIYSDREAWRRAKAAWQEHSPEYEPSLSGRLRAFRGFFLPVFMIVFGSVTLLVGTITAVLTQPPMRPRR